MKIKFFSLLTLVVTFFLMGCSTAAIKVYPHQFVTPEVKEHLSGSLSLTYQEPLYVILSDNVYTSPPSRNLDVRRDYEGNLDYLIETFSLPLRLGLFDILEITLLDSLRLKFKILGSKSAHSFLMAGFVGYISSETTSEVQSSSLSNDKAKYTITKDKIDAGLSLGYRLSEQNLIYLTGTYSMINTNLEINQISPSTNTYKYEDELNSSVIVLGLQFSSPSGFYIGAEAGYSLIEIKTALAHEYGTYGLELGYSW